MPSNFKLHKSQKNNVILMVPLFLAFMAGVVTSYLSVGIVNINLNKSFTNDIFCLIQVSFTALVWLFEASRSKFQQANLKAFLVFSLFIVISVLWEEVRDSTVILFLLGLVFLVLAILSFLQLYFSFLIIGVSFKPQVKRIILRILILIYVATSIAISYRTLVDIHEKNSSLFSSTFWVDVLFSSLPPIMISLSSTVATTLSQTQSPHSFLRTWAVAISTLGNSSFYRKNLDHANFAGEDLSNIDLRAHSLYRTCFQSATGLERARVDDRYLDLNIPKVQKLLTHGCADDQDFSRLNLRGAYLQRATLPQTNFTDTELTGADFTDADLQGCLFVRSDVTGVDFTGANLTGICIQDWNINNQTLFTNVQCDYVFRKLDEQGQPTDRFPADRNFEPREFESLYQEVGNVVELIFKEGVNWKAVAFTLQKLQIEDEGLGLELRGIEKRGDLWVVKVAHNETVSGTEVERRLYPQIEEMQKLLAAKEQQINKLLGIASDQAEALKELSKKPFGNSFYITGSTITNLTGEGRIDYVEAAQQVRNLVAATNSNQMISTAKNLISQLQHQQVAMTANTQLEFIQQMLVTEAQKDTIFRRFLLEQGQQIVKAMPQNALSTAIQGAIAQLNIS